MNRRSLLSGAAAAAALGAMAGGPAIAQDAYPSKPITLVCASAAGGATDIAARKTAELMSQFLGQPVIVENRPGAGTLNGTRYALEAEPDGYTIMSHSSTLSMIPFTYKEPGFDARNDLIPIGAMLRQANVFSVGQDSPFTSLTELIDYSKEHPDELTYASGGPASSISYVVEMLKAETGANLAPVQYSGAGDSFPDVIAGRVSMISSGYSGQFGFYENGQLRPLAVSGDKRIPSIPDVPTLRELGIDLEVSVWLGLLALKGTPDDIVQKLSEALKFALDNQARQEEIVAQGSDPTFLSPAEFKALLDKEAEDFAELAKITGMQPQ